MRKKENVRSIARTVTVRLTGRTVIVNVATGNENIELKNTDIEKDLVV